MVLASINFGTIIAASVTSDVKATRLACDLSV